MNHAERKAQKRAEKNKPTYSYTADQIDAIRQQAAQEAYDKYIAELGDLKKLRSEATEDALKMLISVPVLVLSDKFDFDDGDMALFMGYVNTWVKAINQDENTISEVVDEARKICNFEIEFR